MRIDPFHEKRFIFGMTTRAAASLLAILLYFGASGWSDDAVQPFDHDEYAGRTIKSLDEGYAMIKHRFYNAPTVSSKAPEFELKDVESGEMVSLASLHQEKPVVLVFGSFGCDAFRDGVEPILKLIEKFGDQFQFTMVYIREAHSFDGFWPDIGKMYDPKTNEKRVENAQLCVAETGLPIRVLADTVDDRVAIRWGGWPVRLFVVDQRGTVVYAGETGPWGYNPGAGYTRVPPKGFRTHPDRFSQVSLETFLTNYRPGGAKE